MALLRSAVSLVSKSLITNPLKCSVPGKALGGPLFVPSRTKFDEWIDHRMARDVKRRKCIKEYAKLRDQIVCLKRNTILPEELQKCASKEIAALPSDSCLSKSHARCVLTSRARGRYRKFRMSRIIWRHLADYNQISGVERAMWGWN